MIGKHIYFLFTKNPLLGVKFPAANVCNYIDFVLIDSFTIDEIFVLVFLSITFNWMHQLIDHHFNLWLYWRRAQVFSEITYIKRKRESKEKKQITIVSLQVSTCNASSDPKIQFIRSSYCVYCTCISIEVLARFILLCAVQSCCVEILLFGQINGYSIF